MRMRTKSGQTQQVRLEMTAMIDVVFQLLIFFIMSLQIVTAEGDLAVKMPAQGESGAPASDFRLPLLVHLKANASGELASIELGQDSLATPDQLRARILELLAERPPSELAIELICDDELRYEHTMASLTAVSGMRKASGQITPLVTDVRLRRASAM